MRRRRLFVGAGQAGTGQPLQMLLHAPHLLLQPVDLFLLAGNDVVKLADQVILVGDFGLQFDDALFHAATLLHHRLKSMITKVYLDQSESIVSDPIGPNALLVL